MDAKELKNFSVEELKSRVHQWREELFRSKFKTQSSETKDTSILRKLRRDIARGLTVLNQKVALGTETSIPVSTTPAEPKRAKAPKSERAPKAEASSVSDKPVEDKVVADKPVKRSKKRQEGEKK